MGDTVNNISPIDGRYTQKTTSLKPIFSEAGLIRYRTKVEIEYLDFLLKLLTNDEKHQEFIEFCKQKYEDGIPTIKQIEAECNHDVKSVEIYLDNLCDQFGVPEYKPFVHFGLTSQDINSLSYTLQIHDAVVGVMIPHLDEIRDALQTAGNQYKDVPMLSRTHGQPATPTTVGFQFMVFYERLEEQLQKLENYQYSTKFGGATGGLNAHYVAYPKIDWIKEMDKFVVAIDPKIGIKRKRFTTQIDTYDNWAELFDILKRINVILLDLSRDIWQLISLEYFHLKIVAKEVGSSTMPHKVNPIDFENAEGNIEVANSLFEMFCRSLPISRLQRDLSDSTVMRNVGTAFGNTLIAYTSLTKGLNKLEVNEPKLRQDLLDNYAVVAEGIQTVLRREGVQDAYDLLKKFTRNHDKMGKQQFDEFINSLFDKKIINEMVRDELKNITPLNYLPSNDFF